jgi:hypothetical protein
MVLVTFRRGELAAVVAADVVRHTPAHEQIAQPYSRFRR